MNALKTLACLAIAANAAQLEASADTEEFLPETRQEFYHESTIESMWENVDGWKTGALATATISNEAALEVLSNLDIALANAKTRKVNAWNEFEGEATRLWDELEAELRAQYLPDLTRFPANYPN